MPRAIWNGTVLAESDDTQVVEGNHYFPATSLKSEFLRESDQQTFCVWKGTANYYDVVVGDDVNPGAAWTYRKPSRMAARVKDHVAFWQGVQVEK